MISEHLSKIQSKLPTWFKMRKDPRTIGARFLNVMGLSLDDIAEILQYAYEQQFLPTADLSQVDIVYKASVSALSPDMKVQFSTDYYELSGAESLEHFFRSKKGDKLNHKELFYDNPFYVDYERGLVYVRNAYDIDDTYKEGKINMKVYNSSDTLLLEQTLKLSLHHVWNFFDEFGLLLSTPRLYGEKNADYKKRLYQVFTRPANSSMEGLYNGIARELGMIKEATWYDGSEDLILRDSRVKVDSIFVDDEVFPEEMVEVDGSGRTILTGELAYEGQERTVKYIAGITMHELHNKQDTAFQAELFDIDGHATAVLQYYVDIINNKVPVLWNHFVWGVGFWDIANPEMSGYGFIPTFYDARFSGWAKYQS